MGCLTKNIMTKTANNSSTPTTKKVGVIFGKFFPLHKGHLYMIDYAASQLDELHIFVCTSEKRDTNLFYDSSLIVRPTRKQRTNWLEFACQNNKKIKVYNLQEDNTPSYPNGWQQWSNLVLAKFNEVGIEPQYVFTSEPQDIDNYKTYLNLEGVLVDPKRNFVHISGTKCRKKLFENYEYIADFLRKPLALNVILNINKKANNFDKYHLDIERVLKAFAIKYGISYFTAAGSQHCYFANGQINLCKDKMDMIDYHSRGIEQKFGHTLQSMKPLDNEERIELLKYPLLNLVVDVTLGGTYKSGNFDKLEPPVSNLDSLIGKNQANITINPKFLEKAHAHIEVDSIKDIELPLLKAIYNCIHALQVYPEEQQD